MFLFPYLSYRLNRLKYPGHADFLEEGLGIAARARRARRFWQKHLDNCAAFQRHALAGLQGGKLAVLGAGRLLDLDYQALAGQFRELAFYDADPGALPYWKKAAKQLKKQDRLVTFHLCDITGQVMAWSAALKVFLAEHPRPQLAALAAFLRDLPEKIPPRALERAEAIISLNLLSQIPIHWNERFLAALAQHRIIKEADETLLPEDLRATLRFLNKTLQLNHLRMLSSSGANAILLFTDIYFHYYQREVANWQTEKALYFESGLEDGAFRPAGSAGVLHESWLWHIAPQGIEEREFGVIHEVRATAFRRSRDVAILVKEAFP